MQEMKNLEMLEDKDLMKLNGGAGAPTYVDVTIIAEWLSKIFG